MAPKRRAVRAASRAVSPPPITATRGRTVGGGRRVGGPQEIEAVPDLVQGFAACLQQQAFLAAYGQEDRGKIPAQILQMDIPPQPGAEPNLGPQLGDERGLAVQDLPG